jgi:glycosyltransferase involved in cell wall biosynthesis
MEPLTASSFSPVERGKSLFLFTNEYPFGKGETFIENELITLAKKFQTIYLFPLKKSGQPRILPIPSANVIFLLEKQHVSKWKLVFKKLFLIKRIFVQEFRRLSAGAFIKSFGTLKSILLINMQRAELLEEFLHSFQINEIRFYSFWTDDWATVLSLLKQKRCIPEFISRVHGYDLYEDRWPNKVIPFRNFQLQQVSRIFAASRDGLKYLQINYPTYQHKFFLKHLAVFDNGINDFYQDDELVIVSCSSIVDLKRVHFIPQILEELTIKVRWIHFGDGPGKNVLEEKIQHLPVNISGELRGYVENADLIHFYKTQKVNLFLHLSATEGGVPLVLQEAASFGIPLMGTNVGGVVEIVTAETGILIPADFNVSDVASKITSFHKGDKNTLKFRTAVRDFWLHHFSAEKELAKSQDLHYWPHG